ncbi:hypothetical protein PSAC2689_20487 [Paraburkholderia sacchari]
MLQHRGRFTLARHRVSAARNAACSWSVSLFIGFAAGRLNGAAYGLLQANADPGAGIELSVPGSFGIVVQCSNPVLKCSSFSAGA